MNIRTNRHKARIIETRENTRAHTHTRNKPAKVCVVDPFNLLTQLSITFNFPVACFNVGKEQECVCVCTSGHVTLVFAGIGDIVCGSVNAKAHAAGGILKICACCMHAATASLDG